MDPKPLEGQVGQPDSLASSKRRVSVDQTFANRATINTSFRNYFFQRLVAKEVRFEDVDFTYTIFDMCYLRKCKFMNCDFTGCRFVASSLYGSSFEGCVFDYSIFERTLVDGDILNVAFPGHENLKLKFARTLRMNFQSLGDSDSTNKAIKMELAATMEHLWKCWHSSESYYRQKYSGWKRVETFLSWVNFKLWDYVWGNGESLWKLGRAIAVLLLIVTVTDVHLMSKDGLMLPSYMDSLWHAPAVFFGIKSPAEYPEIYLAFILAARLLAVGLFLSIIIKRFNRR